MTGGVGEARDDPFDVRTELLTDCAVVRVAGDIDVVAAVRLREKVGLALTWLNPPCVIFDLTEVDFCDSSGLSVMVSALKQARGDGGRVVLGGAKGACHRALTRSGLATVFEMHDTAEAAVRSAEGGAGSGPGRGPARGSDPNPDAGTPAPGPNGRLRSSR
ncbi:MAG: anti-sigma factor antagonist [Streptosporangiales bacterium]|nr:anti-sigma factor antagonist [Streptosporangiales bacterium]